MGRVLPSRHISCCPSVKHIVFFKKDGFNLFNNDICFLHCHVYNFKSLLCLTHNLNITLSWKVISPTSNLLGHYFPLLILYFWVYSKIITFLPFFSPLQTLQYTLSHSPSNSRPLFSLIAVACVYVYVYKCISLHGCLQDWLSGIWQQTGTIFPGKSMVSCSKLSLGVFSSLWESTPISSRQHDCSKVSWPRTPPVDKPK